MESPPTRITRARAAAKAGESAAKSAKAAAPGARARTVGTASGSTKSTAAKRKMRADETQNEHGIQQQPTAGRALRARPRRGVESQEEAPVPAAAPAKVARARLGSAKSESSTQLAGEQGPAARARARGRPRKTPASGADEPIPDAAKEATRSRAGAAASAGAAAAKPVTKKTVKFQEPDKENMGSRVKAKEPFTTGLRSRPARHGGAVAASTRRTTRASATASSSGQKKPLSPKKVTQMPVVRDGDSSEDELAEDGAKARMTSAVASAKKSEPTRDKDSTAVMAAPTNGSVPSSFSLVSPPRRLPPSPLKDSLKSPARRRGHVSGSAAAASTSATATACHADYPGFKTPLLQSAAKRPQSPVKGLTLPPTSAGSPHKIQSAMKSTMFQSPAKRALLSLKPMTEPRPSGASSFTDLPRMQPRPMASLLGASVSRPSQKLMAEEDTDSGPGEDGPFDDSTGSPHFSGRLSAVVPRHVDPALDVEAAMSAQEENGMRLVQGTLGVAEPPEVAAGQSEEAALVVTGQQAPEPDSPTEEGGEDPMALDDIIAEMEESAELTLPTPGQWVQQTPEGGNPMYQLRQKDLEPCYDFEWASDSEDGLAPVVEAMATTPARPMKSKDSRRSTIGLTSLAEQFGSWSTADPVKADDADDADAEPEQATSEEGDEGETRDADARHDTSPLKGSFFEDEMLVHGDGVSETKEDGVQGGAGFLSLDDMVMTDEDVALAQEADDMSAMGLRQTEATTDGQSFDDGLSEASQEYGDENQGPAEGAMWSQAAGPVTPARPQQQRKTFYTTTKVPLKPADESTPSPLKKRSLSASRVAPRRPSSLSRSMATISCSPAEGRKGKAAEAAAAARTDVSWSAAGTPARTPRRDPDPGLLRGAVVFVDVHTAEGSDASSIFVELLSQMGARCVKAWHWSPASAAQGESLSSKVGITHVVYKDGGKRTLEKVRWAGGLVHCVGVSWVLDCEREDEWLDEAHYRIDTSQMPRGGVRRRKSMEPRALANLDGAVISGSPTKAASRTPANRRDSTVWMRTPSDRAEQDGSGDGGDDEEDLEWSCALLTPVPKTPAPEAVARYAAELSCDGDDGDEDADEEADGDGDDSAPTRETLATRSCPPKRHQYRDKGAGILSREEDEHVLVRLMAARRKSLQFAPKIGSPLSRAWD